MHTSLHRHLPADTIVVRTYAQLDNYLAKFAGGHLGLLLLLGRAGTGKTYCMKRALGLAGNTSDGANEQQALYVEGHVQPFGLYQKLWEHRDQPVVLDDLDRLYSDPRCVRLLKPLCNHPGRRSISWITNTTCTGSETPSRFTTTSHVALIANQWKTIDANVRALEDRAIVVEFAPSNTEVHRNAVTWIDDNDVCQVIERWLQTAPTISLRHYEKGSRLRRAGFSDWRQSLLQMLMCDSRLAVVAALDDDRTFDSEAGRVSEFSRLTGLSRPSYFRLKTKLAVPKASRST